DTTTLRIDVYARAPQEEGIIDTRLAIVLEDPTGRTATVMFESDESTAFGRFITYETQTIDFGEAPYRMVGITLLSDHDTVSEFEHMVYLDNLVAVNASGETTLLNSFEPDTYDKWQWISGAGQQQVLFSTA